MPNPKLSEEQRNTLFAPLIREVRALMADAADGDTEIYWALRRKLYKELSYDERGKPSRRKALKKRLHKSQNGTCPHCGFALPETGSVNDRTVAVGGYTDENVTLICPTCDVHRQQTRGYTDD
ncbi:MAG: hypothetical protein ABL888_16120 [Pirellulaceae bacterium]